MSYKVTIPGTYALPDINNMIVAEEAGAAKFSQSTADAASRNNIVTFEEVDEAPPPCTLTRRGEPAPPGTEKTWEGVMIVQKKKTDVVLYR